MNRHGKQPFSPFFVFAIIILIPSSVLGIRNGNKLMSIYITHPDRYGLAKATLLTNHHRKYNNHATYRFSYGGKTSEGSDGSILWGAAGKKVTIYFEKNNTDHNGILSRLFFLAIGQWVLVVLSAAYVIYKFASHARKH